VAGNFKIQGAKEAIDRLKNLNLRMQRKYIARATRKGANVIRTAAQESWKRIDNPKTPNKIWQYVTVRSNSRLGRQYGGIAMLIGMRGGSQDVSEKKYKDNKGNRKAKKVGQTYSAGSPVYYWRFLNLGTRKYRPGLHLMETALTNNGEKAASTMVDDLNAGIDEALSAGG
jgi:HK97 gp10 family phage protein